MMSKNLRELCLNNSSFVLDEIDINDHAMRILEGARDFAAAILKKRAEMDQTGDHQTPLLAFIDEHHDKPANKLFQLATAAFLKDQEILLAYEAPHNFLKDTIKFRVAVPHAFGLDWLKGISFKKKLKNTWREIQSNNDNNKFQALAFFESANKGGFSYAPYSWFSLIHYGAMNNIPMAFTDVVTKSSPSIFGKKILNTGIPLNIKDPSTKRIARRTGIKNFEQNFSALQRNGIHIRNAHMIHHAKKEAQKFNSRIILQTIGAYHLSGNGERESFDESLSGLCLKTQQSFVAASLTPGRFIFSHLSKKDAKIYDESFIHYPEIPNITAQYNSITGKSIKNSDADIQCAKDEADYFNLIRCHPEWQKLGTTKNIPDPNMIQINAEVLSKVFFDATRGRMKISEIDFPSYEGNQYTL